MNTKPLYQVCNSQPLPLQLLDPLISKYRVIDWHDERFNVANPVFQNVSGQVIVVIAEGKCKVGDDDLMALLDHCFPGRRSKVFRCMIANLQVGRVLDWHIDGYEFHFQCNRYHIPLITNDRCRLETRNSLGSRSWPMERGHFYTFDNNINHRTYNLGDEDRINIVVDILPDDLEMDVAKLIKHRYYNELSGKLANAGNPT